MTAYVIMRNPGAVANRLCALVLVCFMIWCFGKTVNHFPEAPYALAIFFQKIVIVGAWSFSSFLLLFALALTGRNRYLKNTFLWLALFTIPVCSIILQWVDSRLLLYVPRSFGWGLAWQENIFTVLLLGYIFLSTLLAALICLVFSFSSKVRNTIIQCRLIAGCILAGAFIGYTTNFLAPVFGWDIPDFAQNLGLIWMGGMVFAVSRYNLFVVTPAIAADEILSNMSDALIMTDADGRVVASNPPGLELLKIRFEEIRGARLTALFAEESFTHSDAELMSAGGEIHDKDVMLKAGDGQSVPVSISISQLTDEKAEVVGLLVIARDISERIRYQEELRSSREILEKRIRERTSELVELNQRLTAEVDRRQVAAEALEQSESLFRLISDQSLLGIVLLQENRVVYANTAWADMTEYEIEEMLSWDPKAFLTRVHPDDREKIMEQAQKKQAGAPGYETSYEWRLISKSGKEKWISMYSKPVRYDGAGADLATMIDVTESKRIFLSLQESEAKYRLVVENANDAIFILQDEVIRFVNQKGCEMTGYSREEIVFTPFVNLIHAEDRKSAAERYLKRIRGESVYATHSFRAIHKSGESIWIQSNAAPFRWRGKPAVLSIVRDLSHEKKIEKMLHHMQRLEAVGSMAGGIAHDFNNILTPILGYAEMLKEDLPKQSLQREHADHIVVAAERAKELIYRILSFSSQQILDKQNVDILAVVEESIKLSRALLPKSIHIDQVLAEDCGTVAADPTQIHQVVMNVITNGKQAMLETGGVLTISLQRLEDYQLNGGQQKTCILLSVEDTGVGMSKEVMDKIFNPYFSTKEHGSGLGLSVTSAIIQDLNGHIDVRSEVGKGTSFDIYLPVSVIAESPRPPERKGATLQGNEHVMLIDDERAILALYEKILQRKGYQVNSFDNPTKALAEFEQNPAKYDLVITDMSMPELTGEMVAKSILRNNDGFPIILCTGYSDLFSAKEAIAAGIRAYLMKPVTSENLLRTVRSVLG